jgi:hypothetical protein
LKNFSNFSKNTSEIKKYDIPITNAQIEAIKILDEKNYWLTSENEGGGYPKLIRVKLN